MALRQQSTPPPGGDDSFWVKDEFKKAMDEGAVTGAADEPDVYMGARTTRGRPGDPAPGSPDYLPGSGGAPRREERIIPLSEAQQEFNRWPEKRRRDFIAQAKIGGLMPADGGMVEGARLWRMLTEEAVFYHAQGQKISPWDIMSTYVKDAGGADAVWQRDPSNPDFEVNRLTGERRYSGPRFKTTTQSRTDLTDPATAAAVATSVWQQMMGRDPGAGELAGFASALQQAEQANPVQESTTTEYDPVTGEAVGSNTVSEGGLDAAGRQHMAQQRVKGTEEYGVVQAATTYSNSLEDAVWGAPGLGR